MHWTRRRMRRPPQSKSPQLASRRCHLNRVDTGRRSRFEPTHSQCATATTGSRPAVVARTPAPHRGDRRRLQQTSRPMEAANASRSVRCRRPTMIESTALSSSMCPAGVLMADLDALGRPGRPRARGRRRAAYGHTGRGAATRTRSVSCRPSPTPRAHARVRLAPPRPANPTGSGT